MAGKKAVENTKKVAGNARKAEAAAKKSAAEDAQRQGAEEDKWQQGAKSNSKKEAEAAKKAELAKKKAEREALAKEEESSLNARAEPKKSKALVKKTRGLDLSQLDDEKPSAISATGIDNALDALSLTAGGDDSKIDKHPERRFAAAYAKYEERRLNEMKQDGSGVGLRLEQRKQRIRKEFDKSPENPFNQVTASYNSSRGDLEQLKSEEMTKIEKRLGN
ncbi:Coiled-coil domain-containing-like protein [Cladobotryum mycophilum]|uniref:Coiled-coil domain-containing-like protein n=1 Tax=Cladobotryum mycophilum TaxID=491253 RepID=A0ABR0T244_9HYPO